MPPSHWRWQLQMQNLKKTYSSGINAGMLPDVRITDYYQIISREHIYSSINALSKKWYMVLHIVEQLNIYMFLTHLWPIFPFYTPYPENTRQPKVICSF